MNGILGGPSAIGTMTTDLFDWMLPSSDPPPLMQKAGGVTSYTPAPSSGGGGGGTAMPWGVKSADTAAFQSALNAALKAKGKPAIQADGVLGPGTCGAAKYADMDPGGSVCKSYSPYPPAGGGGSYIAPAAAATAPSAAAAMYAPKSKSNALLIGAAVGGLALVGLVIAKKKGWIK